MIDLLVFTDLDGTLLDHHDYSCEEALPAIERLASAGSPLIFNSSKTAAEIKPLRKALDNRHPYIIENGSAVWLAKGYFKSLGAPCTATAEDDEVHAFGPNYQKLITKLHELRSRAGYRFKGFYDMSNQDVANLTGLSLSDAALAKKRAASEPLLWQDTEESLSDFRCRLLDLNLYITKGGRFHHVMGPTDKAQAMQWLTDQYRSTWPERQWTTVALGDGPNDQAMLEAADIAVPIPPAVGVALKLKRTEGVIYTEASGPRGWQIAIDSILDDMTNKGV